jgi:hypothetical protein
LIKVALRSGDRVIMAGDIVDRGPFSVDTVRFVRKEGFEMIEGNHEEKHVRYQRHWRKHLADPTYKIPMRPFIGERMDEHQSLTEAEHDWLGSLPAFIRLEHEGRQWIINHGGLPSDRPPERQDRKLLVRCRTVHHDTGAYLSSDDPRKPPPGAVYWATRYSLPESVIHGHIVHKDFVVRKDVSPTGALLLGIDTGCVFGGYLTAAVLHPGKPDPQLVSVPAIRRYVTHAYGDLSE